MLFYGELDWCYWTTPQRHCSYRRIHCPRGKMLGGCHSHNASVWVHGHPTDFDNWAYQGNPGWDDQSILPVLKKIEDWRGPPSEFRGQGGPLHVEPAQEPNAIAEAFVESGRDVGLPVIDDHNGPDMEGIGFFNMTIKDGRRNTVVDAYLRPALERSNLTAVTQAETRKLILDRNRCSAVEYTHQGKSLTARANREVILCAGAIGSPRVLLLSGIGPAAELAPLGIPVALDLPGVGRNLQDHPLLAGINYECRGRLPTIRNNGAESTFWWKTDSRLACPDIQPVVIEFPFVSPELAEQIDVPRNCYAIAPSVVRPASRGTVRLRSADPSDEPLIDMNYMACEADLRAMLAGIEMCREMGQSQAFQEFRKRELMPGNRSRSEMIEFIRMATSTYFHPAGSCKMGVDADSVVDPQLQVHGLEGLRVADASIMPTVTTGNTNAPTVMIAEKAAEMILSAAGA
jgi:choline dehydrogenase